jgi:hypothetical protein
LHPPSGTRAPACWARPNAAENLKTVLLLGDLNGTVDDRGLTPLTSRMNTAERGFAFSFPATFPTARVDQVMARSATVVKPALSSVALDTRRLGTLAVDQAARLLAGSGMLGPGDFVVRGELPLRESA